jgi:hypothetical protein
MSEVEISEHCTERSKTNFVSERCEREEEAGNERTCTKEKRLLNVLLAKMSDVGLDDVEQLCDDRSDASEEAWPDLTLPNHTTSIPRRSANALGSLKKTRRGE